MAKRNDWQRHGRAASPREIRQASEAARAGLERWAWDKGPLESGTESSQDAAGVDRGDASAGAANWRTFEQAIALRTQAAEQGDWQRWDKLHQTLMQAREAARLHVEGQGTPEAVETAFAALRALCKEMA